MCDVQPITLFMVCPEHNFIDKQLMLRKATGPITKRIWVQKPREPSRQVIAILAIMFVPLVDAIPDKGGDC